MALNREYFEAIHIDVVKKKYYNANKVEAVFSDIKEQALAMYEENRSMKEQLSSINDSKHEIVDAVLSAKAVCREMLEKARAEAAEIVAEAERKRDAIMEESMRQQEYAVNQVHACYARIKEQHMAGIEALNAEWQNFLCGLYPQEEVAEKTVDDGVPADLSEKVGAIAKELFAIGCNED